MAPPLNFKPKPMAFTTAFQAELDRAPKAHTEALLSLYALLQEAHDHGWLDAARGLIAGAPTAVSEVAKYANTKESIAAMRNIVSLAKILGSIDPDVLHEVSVAISSEPNAPLRIQKPSSWKLFRSIAGSDVLRGAIFTAGIVALVGRAIGKRQQQ